MTLMFELGVILLGEIRCLSLQGFKGLKYKAKESQTSYKERKF